MLRIPLTKYGLREIILGSCVFAALAATSICLYPPATVAVAVLWMGYLAFFRDPDRRITAAEGELLSPADGTVHDVETVDAPGDFLSGPVLRIGIFMSVLNCHVNRSPAAGTVRYARYYPGRFHDARKAAARRENEHNLIGMELTNGRRIMVNQISGALARRIVCQVKPDHRLHAGQRYGMVKFGSRVELILPESDQLDVAVKPGDKVKAGLSVLAVYRSVAQTPDTREAGIDADTA